MHSVLQKSASIAWKKHRIFWFEGKIFGDCGNGHLRRAASSVWVILVIKNLKFSNFEFQSYRIYIFWAYYKYN